MMPMRLSIVLSTQSVKFEAVALKGDFENNVAKIAGWGYEGVEIAIRDPKLVDVDALDKVVAAHGLKVPAIGTGQAWGEEGLSFTSSDSSIRRMAVDRINSHIPLAAHFHALIIIGLIRGITPKGQTFEQSMDYLVDCLRECTREAEQKGVRLALEPINRYETDLIHTVSQGMDLITKVGADNLGLLLDTFHMNIEEADMHAAIRECGRSIFHFHVADSNRWHPGAGHLDFSSLLKTLASTGYPGWISGEFMPKPDADTAAKAAIQYIGSLK
jgi:5-keto-L-gluconate epimerase